jgi:hypothetical protein
MTQDEVKALFVYEPLTGLLRRVGGRKTYPWHGTGKNQRYLATTIAEKPTTCTNLSGSITTALYRQCWTI